MRSIKLKAKVNGRLRAYKVKTRAKTLEGKRKALYRHLHKLGYQYTYRHKQGWSKQVPKAKPVAKPVLIPAPKKKAKSITLSNIVVSDWEGDKWSYPDITVLASPDLSNSEITQAVNLAIKRSKRKVLAHDTYEYASADNIEIGIQDVLVDLGTRLASTMNELYEAIKYELDTLGFTHERSSHKR